MSDEKKKELEAAEAAQKEKLEDRASPLVQDIINGYPIDRERVRDTLLVNISTGLNRIANALEYFANQDVADRKGNQIMKDQKADSEVK